MREVQKMKTLCRRRTLSLIAIALFFGVSCYRHWDSVFQFLVKIPVVGWLMEYNFPPSDFYVPLISVPLKSGRSCSYFTCKYAGRYEMNIAGVDTNSLMHSGVDVHWQVYDKSGHKLRDCGGEGTFALASAHGESENTTFRYCYDIFFAPDDLPTKTPMRASIICAGAVDDFVRRFPAARIEVVKCFDK